ncbi:hypothetical protein CAPTEDRAFT_188859 [Capitella teleta]|uniref:G-protein coupled receptors family 1 profile domain-containing protein n=1 Tax=Capitella teleta TaxID=283909 RepID=R7TMD3_CAPTE|nr:hypothetical protein CAPTEDRAFT_188859 [Capitella teleta]|eukprot:ELT95008.1 hypothetical protein CAPTEDRAFT_188859 [Capitella teleta]
MYTNNTINTSVRWAATMRTGEEPSRWATAIGAGVMLVFFVEGLLGSIWIMLAVLTRRKVWNVINIFIVSLCANDLLVLSLILVLIIDSYIWGRWTAGAVMCKLNPEFTVAFTGCSLWHSALIAIHRYLVVVHNNLYKRMSRKAYVAFVLIAARAIPFACTLPGFTLDTSDYVPKLLRCILLPREKVRIITITMVQIILPCVVVVMCYLCVFVSVVRIGRRVQAANNRAMRREIQITKMFGVIFLMIMFGFIPYSAVRNADRGNRFSADIYVIVTVCYAIGTCLSPLVYGVMSRELRRTCCLQLRTLLTNLHMIRLSPCCADVISSNGSMSCFETSNNMNTYEVSTGGGLATMNDNGMKPCLGIKSSQESSAEAEVLPIKLSEHTSSAEEASTLVEEKKDVLVSVGPKTNHVECNESCRLLAPILRKKEETANEQPLHKEPKESDKETTKADSKGLLFFMSSRKNSTVPTAPDCAATQSDRSREASYMSNSQTDTIENESESATACSEMSAFV